MSNRIIERDRSIIPACDVPLEVFEDIVIATKDIEAVGAYKLGFQLGLEYGLPTVVAAARKHTDKPLIYDHQKASTDIPATGKAFMEIMQRSGIDAVIFFPQAGPRTLESWVEAAQERNLGVIVGGEMTHEGYLASEGGYISDNRVSVMYKDAIDLGVTNFVVPGNKPKRVQFYRGLTKSHGVDPTFFAPGFVAQGGSISDAGKEAGDKWHAIVGRGIYWNKENNKYNCQMAMTKAAEELTNQL